MNGEDIDRQDEIDDEADYNKDNTKVKKPPSLKQTIKRKITEI